MSHNSPRLGDLNRVGFCNHDAFLWEPIVVAINRIRRIIVNGRGDDFDRSDFAANISIFPIPLQIGNEASDVEKGIRKYWMGNELAGVIVARKFGNGIALHTRSVNSK